MANRSRSVVNSLALHVGMQLKIARNAKGLTLRQAGANLGCPFTHLNEVELGYFRCSFELLWNAAQEYGVDMNHFVDGYGES